MSRLQHWQAKWDRSMPMHRTAVAVVVFAAVSFMARGAIAQPREQAPPAAQGGHGEPHVGGSSNAASMPMSREASGTSWNPDTSPVHALHFQTRGWMLMLHGNATVGLSLQGTERGGIEGFGTNWLMAMMSHALAGGQISFRGMIDLEPLTVGAEGYPLLLQTGETYRGEPLVDRQHPHDLFMEIAARYVRPIAGGVWLELYGGPAGEPALGPVTYPHRASAMPDPLAPLGHHWLDSTHITFGVVTAGLFHRRAKLEGSWFNGREPDERRYGLDLRPFDSYAARLSVNPAPRWSLQVSYGFLASPEAREPDQAIHRTTASVAYNRPLGPDANWATTVAWGRNTPAGEGRRTDALLLESALDTGRWGTIFLRAEQVEKDAHDFGLAALDEEVVTIHGAVLGGLYELGPLASLRPGIGVRVSLGHIVDSPALEARYGTRWPLGGLVYINLRPARMPMTLAQHTMVH